MRILFISTHNVACGIADYNSSMMKAASSSHDCDIEVLPQNTPISKSELRKVADRARKYDAVVIQHEWSFVGYNTISRYDATRFLLMSLRKNRIPTAIIMHSQFVDVPRSRGLMKYFGERVFRVPLVMEINKSPKLKLFVHNKPSLDNLVGRGIKSGKVELIPFPHQERRKFESKRSSSDFVTLLMFGFVSAYKGYETALSALRLLPDNFRLVIAGAQHPNAMQDLTYENILGFIRSGLWNSHRRLPEIFSQFNLQESQKFSKRVILRGHLSYDEIAGEIAAADIVLAPYFAEDAPAGSAAVEWPISLGKPTIVSAVQTFEDYIKAKCVISVTPGAPHHLAKAISDLAESRVEMERLSSSALKYARENSVEAVTNRILSVVERQKT